MTRIEQFNFLLKNMSKLSHENQDLAKQGFNKSQRLCLTLRNYDIEIPIFDSHEDIRKFFTEEKGECEICASSCKLNSNNIKNGFKQFCSIECQLKWRSKRQSKNNTIHRLKDRKKWSENVSARLKKAIAEGRFTPHVSNSWCHSRRKVVIGERVVNVRSTWEEKFLLANPTFDYEKTRIQYIDLHGVQRTYIVDFTDKDGNLYEIKPTSKVGECNEKILAAIKYAAEKNVTFNLVTEKDFSFYEDQKNYKNR
jgi:hypothetical protein